MSLYLKYRPHNFANLVGQDYIRKTILNAIQNQKIAHAYLFCGTRGTGKTSTARLLAKSINCQNLEANGEPCDTCPTCEAIVQGTLVDLIEIDAASNRGIDEIRELKENIQFAPSQSKNKIYIIDEVHMLTKEAFNALLKTLEEPPAHAYFILATTEVHKIPETILSRCQRFNFRKINNKDIVERLKHIAEQENLTYEENALELIAKQANGGMRDAIGLLEQMASEGSLQYDYISQNLGLVGAENINEFYEHLKNQDTTKALQVINQLVENSNNLSEFNREFIEFLREKMLEKVQNNQSCTFLLELIDTFSQAGLEFKNALIPQLPLEIAVIKTCEIKNAPLKESKKEKKGFFSFSSSKETTPSPPKETQTTPPPSSTPKTLKETPSESEQALKKIPKLTLEKIKKNWNNIINNIPTAFVKMSLKTGEPIKLENNLLSIGFSSNFHKEKLENSQNKNEILIALEKIFEQPIKIELTDSAVKLTQTIEATRTQEPENKPQGPTANEIAEEIFTFID